jgi:hypothetical protein
MKRYARTLSVVVAAALGLEMATAMAAEIDGTWVGTVGQSEITFVFKAEGSKLTGTLDNSVMPGATPIKDGKINGQDISFSVIRNLNNAEAKVEWTGKLVGEELRLQRAGVAGNAPAEVVAKRKKE